MRASDRHDCQRKPVYLNDQRRKTICSTVMRHQSFSALRIAAAVGISLSPGFSHRQARRLAAQHIPPQGGMSRAHEKSPTGAEGLNLLTNLHQKSSSNGFPPAALMIPLLSHKYACVNAPAPLASFVKKGKTSRPMRQPISGGTPYCARTLQGTTLKHQNFQKTRENHHTAAHSIITNC